MSNSKNKIELPKNQDMESFAIAYKKIDDNENHEEDPRIGVAECHLNIWKIDVDNLSSKTKLYFDLGLKISSLIEYVYVYIPFEFKENGKDFDLVKKLQNNNQLLCTVFNADYKTQMGQGDTFSKVTNREGTTIFHLHQLGPTKFKIEPFYLSQKPQKVNGQLLRIHIQEVPNDCKSIYIRFRIEPKTIKDIIKTEHISNDILQAAFSKIDMFDFRINEIRNISTDVMDKITGDGYSIFKFDKVHLFFMADTRERVENGSTLKQDSRLLEKNLWSTYLPLEAHKKNYIAHHWKKREQETKMFIEANEIKKINEYKTFDDYRIFFTSIYPNIQPIRLSIYLCVVILLGWCGSMLSFKISHFLPITIPECCKLIIVIGLITIVFLFILCTSIRLIIKIHRK